MTVRCFLLPLLAALHTVLKGVVSEDENHRGREGFLKEGGQGYGKVAREALKQWLVTLGNKERNNLVTVGTG